MKSGTADMVEGPQAWQRFQAAVKKIMSVPKSAIGPSPFGKQTPKKKKRATRKG
jgi:hypothetical protein